MSRNSIAKTDMSFSKRDSEDDGSVEDVRESKDEAMLSHPPPYTCEHCICAPCVFIEHFQGFGKEFFPRNEGGKSVEKGRTKEEWMEMASRYYYKAIKGDSAFGELHSAKALPFCVYAELQDLMNDNEFEVAGRNPMRIWTKTQGYWKREEHDCELCKSRPCKYEEYYEGVISITGEVDWSSRTDKEKQKRMRSYYHCKIHGRDLSDMEKYTDNLPLCVISEIENEYSCRFRVLSRRPWKTWGVVVEYD